MSELEPITESDETLRELLAGAELLPLLPALAYATGDLSLLQDRLRPDPNSLGLPQGGLSTAQQEEIRELAWGALRAHRDRGCPPPSTPSDDDLLKMMEFAVGGSGMGAYLELLQEELGHRHQDFRAPGFHKDELAPGRDLRVLVIGAGVSGILAAHRLRQAGIDFTVVEKRNDVGGTWLDNTYPGCRVDNPNHNYSYSFAQRHDWPYFYSTQPVLLEYVRDCARDFGVRDAIRFETEVREARWSDAEQCWHVTVESAARGRETLTVHAVISAVGQLNRPLLPDIDGRERFAGPAFHSARWDHGVDLAGKRVAVIGTGASAMQLIPEIADLAAEVRVFQRTPAWMVPTPDYHAPVPAALKWLYTHVPYYSEWHRFCIFWRMGDGALEGVRVDPAWRGEGAVSAANDFMRQLLTAYIEAEFAGHPELAAAARPRYPVGAKRVIRDNGVWARTLKRDDVRLVTQPVARVAESGVETVDGELHPADVMVFATGFQASKFLTPMQVFGRRGFDLHAHWQGDARAYLGISIPELPNFFCLYGPNTNIVINGSIIYFSECGTRYILSALQHLLRTGASSLCVKASVHDAYNVAVDRENRGMAWGASDVNSWYKNSRGRVSQNWPFTLLEYWERTRRLDPEHYEVD